MPAPHPSAKVLASALKRIAELERRIENVIRMGPIDWVDPKEGEARILTGKKGGKDQKGPKVRYAQQVGKKGGSIHMPPVKGATGLQLAPGGEMDQAFIIPFSRNDDNPSPRDDDGNAYTFGDNVRIDVDDGSIVITVAGVKWTLTASGLEQLGGDVKHDGKSIGKDHKHVDSGGAGLGGKPV